MGGGAFLAVTLAVLPMVVGFSCEGGAGQEIAFGSVVTESLGGPHGPTDGDCFVHNIQANGVWFWFDGDGEKYTATTCLPGMSIDTVVHVFNSTDRATCNDCMAASDDTPAGLCSALTFKTEVGVYYHILVRAYNADTVGNIQLRVDKAVPDYWTCPQARPDDGVCDCGCGYDPDCENVANDRLDRCKMFDFLSCCGNYSSGECTYDGCLEVQTCEFDPAEEAPLEGDRCSGATIVDGYYIDTRGSEVGIGYYNASGPAWCYGPDMECAFVLDYPAFVEEIHVSFHSIYIEPYADAVYVFNSTDATEDNMVFAMVTDEDQDSARYGTVKVVGNQAMVVFTSDGENHFPGFYFLHCSPQLDSRCGSRSVCYDQGTAMVVYESDGFSITNVYSFCLCDKHFSGAYCEEVSCRDIESCSACVATNGPERCEWCKESDECTVLGTDQCDGGNPNSATRDCPCATFDTCAECGSGTGCGWCFDDRVGTCLSGNENKPFSSNCVEWKFGEESGTCPAICLDDCNSGRQQGYCDCSSTECTCNCYYSFRGETCELGVMNTFVNTYTFDISTLEVEDGLLSDPLFGGGLTTSPVRFLGDTIVLMFGEFGLTPPVHDFFYRGSCFDGLLNQDEVAIDCGGVCAPCPETCVDGIWNRDEEGTDCGGFWCDPCPTCLDGVRNQDEEDIDCGGVCDPCENCFDGVQNQDETGVDCGGCFCVPCTCFDSVQNGGETGVDCGGPCFDCGPNCFDGLQNNGETGVDCGGPCFACPTCDDELWNQDEEDVDCGGICSPCGPPGGGGGPPPPPGPIDPLSRPPFVIFDRPLNKFAQAGLPHAPMPRKFHGAVTIPNYGSSSSNFPDAVLLFFGVNNDTGMAFNDVYRVNPPNNFQQVCPGVGCPTLSLPTARHSFAYASFTGPLQTFVFILGGLDSNALPFAGEQLFFRFKYPDTGFTAVAVPSAVASRLRKYGHAAVSDGEANMYVFGGFRCVDGACLPTQDTWEYNVHTDTWREIFQNGAAVGPAAELPSARAYHSMVWDGDSIILFGGSNGTHTFDDMYIFTPREETWVRVDFNSFSPAVSPSPRSQHSAIFFPDSHDVSIFGGVDGKDRPLYELYNYHVGPVLHRLSFNESSANGGNVVAVYGSFTGSLDDAVCVFSSAIDRSSSDVTSDYAEGELIFYNVSTVLCNVPPHPGGPTMLTIAQRANVNLAGAGQVNYVFYSGQGLPFTFHPCQNGTEISRTWTGVPVGGGPKKVACPTCPAGSYSPVVNADGSLDYTCTQCPSGTFSGEMGQPTCTPCPAGYASSQPGSTECRPCAPGEFSALPGQLSCTNCRAGTFQNESARSFCYECPAGFYQPDVGSTMCEPCPPGRSQSQMGSVSCDPCRAGEAQSEPGSTQCADCLPGYYQDEEQQARCKSCEPGEYQDEAGEKACKTCSTVEYQPSYNASECLQCPDNSNSYPGASDVSDCSCNPDYYGPVDSECVQCTEGMYCPGGTPVPRAEEGWWRASADSVEVLQCIPAELCVGGAEGEEGCREGHDYKSRMCSECLKGYYELNGLCEKCPDNDNTWKFVLGGILLIAGCLALVAVVHVPGPWDDDENEMESAAGATGGNGQANGAQQGGSGALASIPIAISFFQVLATFANFQIAWPKSLLRIFAIASVVNVNIDLASPECSIDIDFYQKWAFQMAVPLVLFGVFCLILVGGFIYHAVKAANQERLWVRAKRWSVLVVAAYLLAGLLAYLFLCQVTLVFFDCTHQPDGSYTLDAEPSLDCYDDKWMRHLPIAVLGIMVYIIAIPVGLACVLFTARSGYLAKRGMASHPLTAFMTKRYEESFYYWELTILARKLLIVVASLFFTKKPIVQCMLAMLALFVSILFLAALRPFHRDIHDVLEFALLLANFAVLFAGVLYLDDDLDKDVSDGLAVVVQMIVILAFIIIITCLIIETKDRGRDIYKKFVLRWKGEAEEEEEEKVVDPLTALFPHDHATAQKKIKRMEPEEYQALLMALETVHLEGPTSEASYEYESVMDDDGIIAAAVNPRHAKSHPVFTKPTTQTRNATSFSQTDEDFTEEAESHNGNTSLLGESMEDDNSSVGQGYPTYSE